MWNVLWFSVLLTIANSVFVVEINKLFKPCPHSSKNFATFPWNLTGVRLFLSEDEKLILDGQFTVIRDIYPPLGLVIYTQKQDKGEWRPTPYGRHVLNFCSVMLSSGDIWYPITKHMNRTTCPLRKGHLETFDMVELESFGFDDVLPDLVGEWRVFVETSLGPMPHKVQVSCIMNEISILEH
ncbi:uncharacterized protein LOC128722597 [Anopheles nili]|uniref:uncharacterized protein LOC128722597 n=1 Tax=Anopheles nili TaxID=185578 RepID=UPI00237BA9EA|nr:uncharacterized protein LOC128722597 [Anopheles nili]